MEAYIQIIIVLVTFITGYITKSKLKCNSNCCCCNLEFIHNSEDNKLEGISISKKSKLNISDDENIGKL